MRLHITTVDGESADRRDLVVNVTNGMTVRHLAAELRAAHRRARSRADDPDGGGADPVFASGRTAAAPSPPPLPGSPGQGGGADPAFAAGRTAIAPSLPPLPGSPGQDGDAEPGEEPDAEDVVLYLGDRPLDPDLPLVAAGVRDGCVLGVGAPPPVPGAAYGPSRHEMPRAADPGVAPVVELQVIGGPAAGQVCLIGVGNHLIGPVPGGSFRLDGPGVPARGVRVAVRPDGTVLVALPEEGTVRLSEPEAPPPRPRADLAALPPPPFQPPQEPPPGPPPVPPGWTPWPLDGELVLGGHLLRVTTPTRADAALVPSPDGWRLDFNRPPRLLPPLEAERFFLPGPPTPPRRQPIPFLIMIAPMFMGLAFVYFFQSYFYLVFCLLSPVMLVANWISGRRGARRQFTESVADYRVRRASLEADIKEKVDTERRLRVLTSPDPATIGLIARGPGARLWERRRGDPDHLLLRVGTVRQQSLLTVEDGSREDNHRTTHWQIPDVPVGVEPAGSGVVGFAGPAEPVRALARWAVAQAAVLHTPRDLRIVILTDEDAAGDWQWARWLPHVRPMPGLGSASAILIGNDPDSVTRRVAELVNTLRVRAQRTQAGRQAPPGEDVDVLVVMDGARKLRDVPGVVQVLKEGPYLRVFPICLDREERLLPEEATAVVTVAGDGLRLKRTGLPDVDGIRPDLVTPEWAERLARSIASVRDVTPDGAGGLPGRVSLLELLDLEPPDAEEIARRWAKRPASTSVLLGEGYDGPFAINLVRDGPHGLIAGTTGSGKSELLQTFVASLAAVNRPDELTFVLVDYKGGSAFKDCVRLPHTLGMVTDLDSHLVQRALDSFTAELIRREHMLAGVGAKDHPEYRALRRRDPTLPPMPRLLIVIDEFATLVRDIPDFIPGLVGLAQRGRSLGLHLILATQRPAGVITNDVRANTALRICLRVTDVMDSQDVLEMPDAVGISPDTPGRALIRQGHRSVAGFQTAYVGAPRPGAGEGSGEGAGEPAPPVPAEPEPAEEQGPLAEELPWDRLGHPLDTGRDAEEDLEPEEDEGPTDLTALVDAIGEAARLSGHTALPSPWLPPLPGLLTLDDLPRPGPAEPGRLVPAPWALEDLPALQKQPPVLLDLDEFGHLFVLGMPRTGRSQVLRTMAAALARANSSADVHFHGIDAGGGSLAAVSALPHTGAIVPRTDLERLGRLLKRFVAELARRQELLAAHSAATITELRAQLPPDRRPPHLMLFVDGWDTLHDMIDEIEEGRLVGHVMTLLREGAPAGVHVVATSERALLTGRVAALCDDRLLFRMHDLGDYMIAGIDRKRVSAAMGPGRGLRTRGGGELQAAVLPGGVSGKEQAEALRRIGAETAERDADVPPSLRPFRVETLPASVRFADAYARAGDAEIRPLTGLLGLGGDDVLPVWVDFSGVASCFVVSGPPGSGRSTVLASLAVSLLRGGTGVVVLAPRESPLRALHGRARATVITSAAPAEEEVRKALAAVGGAPAVILADDVDLLASPPAETLLRDLASSGRDQGVGIACAGTPDALVTPRSGWVAQVRRSRQGVLLAPQSGLEGDIIGMRLPHTALRGARTPGRGLTAGEGGTALLTVLVPETVPDRDAP